MILTEANRTEAWIFSMDCISWGSPDLKKKKDNTAIHQFFLYILKIARDCWYQESAKEENSFQIVDFVCSSNHFEICSYRNYFMSKPNAAEGSFQNLMYCVTLESFKK